MDPALYYGTYLGLDKVLSSQHPKSFEAPNTPAHDEMLFIIIHQAYELWFKQILFELEFVTNVFRKAHINDNSEDLNLVRHRLQRVMRIIELLNNQISVLDTMTPLDFLEFRNLLTPSSGFQSLQFRLIEARLGLKLEMRHNQEYYKRTNEGGFSEADYIIITEIEKEESILMLINRWLERMPFFNPVYWGDHVRDRNANLPFWTEYRDLYKASLSEREAGKINHFDYVFFEQTGPLEKMDQEKLRAALSPAAMRAALFIMLYRDFPVFQTSFQILDSLVEIDLLLSTWRHKHIAMVSRMIGLRVGTGNTSGSGYLQGALSKHYIFKDLSSLSTFMIPRKHLPILPSPLVQHLSFTT
ncbi:tryptophan 2,3-dioxygenase [Segetibacter sp. 3557_3]|uniref:tryptophan 2,3-dioxygenase family protein n=1 Tax=Segetibacter sp. 3557_3 TaxID=2547429 RepID=UPI00105870C3|nr:tryptophan 2,3-dioxygenase family protein [Segetibacter sp. 3557_3]TDH27736.1 tryptophan 2,3-dioxygenase [Segetibacter sp. 3557_3]